MYAHVDATQNFASVEAASGGGIREEGERKMKEDEGMNGRCWEGVGDEWE